MADPVGDIIGDYRAFAAQQYDRLLARRVGPRRGRQRQRAGPIRRRMTRDSGHLRRTATAPSHIRWRRRSLHSRCAGRRRCVTAAPRKRALVGSVVLDESEPGAWAAASTAAMVERTDTEWLRRIDLDLLADLGLRPRLVRRNGVVVPRRAWDDAMLEPGDEIETEA